MNNASQVLKNGQLLQMPAGKLAINRNDLVALADIAQALYPVKSTAYGAIGTHGTTAVALTTYTSNGSAWKWKSAVDPSNGDFFIVDSYLATQYGISLWRYSASGQFLGTTVVDATNASFLAQITWLSNGNLLVMWYGQASVKFAIYDKFLNLVVGPTTAGAAGANPSANAHVVALSGGGFALAWTYAAVGCYYMVFSNTGAVVKAATAIAGLGTASSGNQNGPYFKLAQLSNNNIAIVSNDSATGSNSLQFLIIDTSGNIVVGLSALTSSAPNAVNATPETAVVTGYFCIAATCGKGYVISNAGVVQGTGFFPSVSTSQRLVLVTDGTYFYSLRNTGTNLIIDRLSTAGGWSAFTTNTTYNPVDAFFDSSTGALIVLDGTVCAEFTLNATTGFPTYFSQANFAISNVGFCVVGNLGDLCALGLQAGKFHVTKYLTARVLGIAQTAVTAGSAGTAVNVNPGPGSYVINPITWSAQFAVAFDHSGLGNKGVLYSNSIVLKGM